ncbi:MAG: hypothetical protein ACRD6W_06315, partial [Nitrososphaerales archaeon]
DNGVQLRFRGKVYCTIHDDLSAALQAKEVLFQEVAGDLRNMLVTKLKESIFTAEAEKDPEELDRLISLMTKYVELLQKLEPQRA